jgi:TonB family protein
MFLVLALLLVGTHRLPAPITEIPESPTPASTVAPNVPHGATMKGVDVNLPTGQSGETWLSDYVSVSVDKDGHYFFDKNEMTEADMRARLIQVHQSDPEAKVFVRGDRDTVHGNVVHLLDVLRSAGFYKISFEIKSEAAKAVPAPKGTETMAVKGIRVNLPAAVGPPSTGVKDFVSIKVLEGNAVFFDNQIVPDDQVLPRLYELHRANPDIKVSISASLMALHGDVITALDKVRTAGITKVAYQIRSAPPQGVPKDEVKEVAGRPGTMSISAAKALAVFAPRPEYPYEARSLYITGSGVCVLTVDPRSGNVTDAIMAQSTASPILDNSTLTAFKRWRFRPGTVTKVKIPITFTMSGASY